MNKLGVAALLAASISAQAEVNNTSPETQNTVDTLKQEVALICAQEKDNVVTTTGAKLSAEQLLQECIDRVSSKETREYLISLGINPKDLPGTTIRERQYESGEFQENITLSELGLDGKELFTVENISSKFEEILSVINSKYKIQFIEGDWKYKFAELSPNEDEVKLLNDFVSLLPSEVKPVPLANALTGIIALKKYSEMDISTLSAAEKVILNANVQSVLAVISPELVENSLDLVLAKGTLINDKPLETEKTYSSIAVNRDVVKEISKVGVELPIELVSEMDDIHKEYQTILVQLKEKADFQATPERTARIMKFHDQYEQSFDGMSTISKMDMLEILETGDDKDSKLKGQKLLDKAAEYIVLLDGGFTEENVLKLRKYHNFIMKFNKTGDAVLHDIVGERISLIESETTRIESETTRIESETIKIKSKIAQTDERISQSDIRLEKLITLRKQMELIAYNHSS